MICKPQQNFKGWVGHSTLYFAYDSSIHASIQRQALLSQSLAILMDFNFRARLFLSWSRDW
jgi:hypothetical protein